MREYRFSLTRIFPYKNGIEDTVFVTVSFTVSDTVNDTGFWHILPNVVVGLRKENAKPMEKAGKELVSSQHRLAVIPKIS